MLAVYRSSRICARCSFSYTSCSEPTSGEGVGLRIRCLEAPCPSSSPEPPRVLRDQRNERILHRDAHQEEYGHVHISVEDGEVGHLRQVLRDDKLECDRREEQSEHDRRPVGEVFDLDDESGHAERGQRTADYGNVGRVEFVLAPHSQESVEHWLASFVQARDGARRVQVPLSQVDALVDLDVGSPPRAELAEAALSSQIGLRVDAERDGQLLHIVWKVLQLH
eukprot:4090339-Prymnesium_polylepis.2